MWACCIGSRDCNKVIVNKRSTGNIAVCEKEREKGGEGRLMVRENQLACHWSVGFYFSSTRREVITPHTAENTDDSDTYKEMGGSSQPLVCGDNFNCVEHHCDS